MKDYRECGLPEWLEESIQNYENGKNSSVWDCLYCELQADINAAEVDQMITSEQAWFLREKYLGLSRKENAGDAWLEDCEPDIDLD